MRNKKWNITVDYYAKSSKALAYRNFYLVIADSHKDAIDEAAKLLRHIKTKSSLYRSVKVEEI